MGSFNTCYVCWDCEVGSIRYDEAFLDDQKIPNCRKCDSEMEVYDTASMGQPDRPDFDA